MRFRSGKLFRVRAYASRLAMILISSCLIAGPPCKAQTTVTLSPGANIQAAVNANPSGTSFILTPGVYRMQSVMAKSGDTFTGQTGAVLNGSQLLTNWVHNGSYWTESGAPAVKSFYGDPAQYCTDPTTGCVYPQDLYLNNKPLVHKLSLPITSGQWYFDYDKDVVYMADDPTGQTVELSVTPYAFYGPSSNVTIQNLIVEKYAAPIPNGAIFPYGPNWIIKSNEIRLNHAAGIKAGNGQPNDNYEQILSNNVHDNGQEGIAVGGGTGTLVQYNTIANNNFANLADGFESGGGKISATTNAQVFNNTYVNNNGNGLWGDCGATGTVFSGNNIRGNRLSGIRYEISHSATISNNTLVDNDQYRGTGACNAAKEIFIASSDHTTVSGNNITSNCAGITLTQDSRNAVVYDSVVHNATSYSGSTSIPARIGGLDSLVPMTMFNANSHNYFDYNTYHFSSPALLNAYNWTWKSNGKAKLTWAQWQAAGQDIHGTAD